MLGSNVLEIGVGLVLTYLCISLVVTAVNELIATLTRARANNLELGIANLLDGTTDRKLLNASVWAKAFFNHQLVNALSMDNERPSYIPSHTFAATLMHLVQRAALSGSPNRPVQAAGGPIPADPTLSGLCQFDDIRRSIEKVKNDSIREALMPLVAAAEADLTKGVTAIEKFNTHLEYWYDHAMDRVSGWYKARTQRVLLVVSIAAAFLLNVDTVAICRQLGRDPTLRAAVVASASQTLSTTNPATGAPTGKPLDQIQTEVGNLSQLGLPIGWGYSSDSAPISDDSDLRRLFSHGWVFLLTKLSGLMLTAFAASLGAPFWFDTLNRLMSIRGTGKSPVERPKMPRVVPQPQNP